MSSPTATGGARLPPSPPTIEPKIILWDGGNSNTHYGCGVSGHQLNYHVDATNSSHVFSVGGRNGDGTELMRVRGDGRVGIGTSNPGGSDSHGGNPGSLNWAASPRPRTRVASGWACRSVRPTALPTS